jgi:hypothetical protein
MDDWRNPGEALANYERWLAGLPLAERTRREYARWVRLFCAWLADGADVRALGADRCVIRGRATTPPAISSAISSSSAGSGRRR